MTGLPSFMRAYYHIMSFMPAYKVVRTSMISWTCCPLWTSAPYLDMDIYHFDMDRLKFSKFAESLFEQQGIANATLDTLWLLSFAIYAANYWIDHAIRRDKVKSIEFTESTRWQAFYLDPLVIYFASSNLWSIKLINVIYKFLWSAQHRMPIFGKSAVGRQHTWFSWDFTSHWRLWK